MPVETGAVNSIVEPRLTTEEAKVRMGEMIDRVTDGERVVIQRHGRDRVAVVPMKDLERLRALDSVAAVA